MRLEDAFLQVVLDVSHVDAPADWTRAAIDGGADLVLVVGAGQQPDVLRQVVATCREEDALVLVADEADVAVAAAADGVHLGRADAPIGHARAAVGVDALVGISAASVDDAKLVLQLGADYVRWDGGAGPAVMSLRMMASAPLFVTVDGLEPARECVGAGVLRLSVADGVLQDGNVAGELADYSRLLGRCI